MNRNVDYSFTILLLASLFVGCSGRQDSVRVLRVATTTSTRDSGLTDRLIPLFEKENNLKVKLIAVGTGKAMQLGRLGEVDVVLVHAEKDELKFLKEGHAVRRDWVMFNYFEILGPENDPAEIRGTGPVSAFSKIRNSKSRFVSRGDDSGTHKRELELWNMADQSPDWNSYFETGQGMGASLIIASEKQSYILCDRGTYLAMKDKVDLVPLASKSELMKNRYGVLCVNPRKNKRIQSDLANRFADFLISHKTQKVIQEFKIGDEALFHTKVESK